MDYALAKKVSEIVKQDSLKEISQQKNSFCDKMNNLFSSISSTDIANLGADVTSFISALHSTKSMQAIIPPEILEGLKKGIYKFNESNGEFLAQVVNSKNGAIVKNLRLEEVQHLSNPAGINNLSMQIATQMKLAEIQELIEDLSVQINRKLDSIIQNQVDTIIAKAEAALIKFEDYKYHPELNVELKDVKFNIDEAVSLIKRDIPNRINSINEIESRKKNWFRKTVTNKDVEDAAKNVSYIQEETQYLQILFMVKFYITKDIQDLKDYSQYLNSVFTKKCRYMLTAWEYRPTKKEDASLEYFWIEKFEKYLNQVTEKTGNLIILKDKNYV